MKLENEFEVPVGIDEAWPVLLDVQRITPCLPGAQLDEDRGDGEYAGQMKLKLGPITSTYKGTIKIEEADEANHRAVMKASARDSRGQGSAAATITSTMESAGDRTKVRVLTDMRVTGPAARMGRGVMQDVSAKLLTQFADCLAAEISRPPEPAAVPEPVAAGDAVPESAAAPPPPPGVTAAQEPAPGSDAVPEPQPAAGTQAVPPSPPPPPRPAPEVLDLGAASREAVLKRAAPVLAALLALLVLLGLRRRR